MEVGGELRCEMAPSTSGAGRRNTSNDVGTPQTKAQRDKSAGHRDIATVLDLQGSGVR